MSDGFRAASFEWMLREAEEFAFHVAAVNRPGKCEGEGVLPVSSTSCVETSRDGRIAFNFASRGVKAMVARELHMLEGLVDEGVRRMKMAEGYAIAGYQVFTELEREMTLFLDKMNVIGPLDDTEIKEFSLEIAGSLFKGPSFRL